jgi:hypothetical protein
LPDVSPVAEQVLQTLLEALAASSDLRRGHLREALIQTDPAWSDDHTAWHLAQELLRYVQASADASDRESRSGGPSPNAEYLTLQLYNEVRLDCLGRPTRVRPSRIPA